MTAPRLKVAGIVRDDSYDGVARLRIDNHGNLYFDAEDVRALALMLANPPAVNRAAQAKQARDESEVRLREESARKERERIAAGASRAADLARLREQFPALADQILGPDESAPAFFIFVPQGGQRAYYPQAGSLHTSDRSRAARFPTQEAALAQVRALEPTPYAIEEATA